MLTGPGIANARACFIINPESSCSKRPRQVYINTLFLTALRLLPFLCSMRLFALLLSTIVSQTISAQVPDSIRAKTDTASRLQIIKAGRYNFEKKDSVTSFLSLVVDAQLKQEQTLFYADSAVLNQNSSVVEAFGNVHINDNDSLHIYAKYMRYNGKEKHAYMKDKVRLTDNKGGVLTTSELHYDLNTKIAVYTTGGKVVNKKTVLTSKEAEYY